MSTVNQTIPNKTNYTSGKTTGSSVSWDKAEGVESFYDVFSTEVVRGSSAPEKRYRADQSRDDKVAQDSVGQTRSQASENKPETRNDDEQVVEGSQDDMLESQEQVNEVDKPERKDVSVEDVDEETETQVVELPEDVAQQIMALQMQVKPELPEQIEVDTVTDVGVDAGLDSEKVSDVSVKVVSGEAKTVKKVMNALDSGKNVKTEVVLPVNSHSKEQKAASVDMADAADMLDSQDGLVTTNTSEDETIDVAIEDSEVQEQELVVVNERQTQAKESKPVAQAAVTVEKPIVASEEKTVKVSNKEQAADSQKLKDVEFSDRDYNNQAAGNFQQNADLAGERDKDKDSRKLERNFNEGISSISGSSASRGQVENVKEALGLNKPSTDNQIDATKNIDAVVKSVKSMVQEGNSTMVVRLDPPSLGQVNIRIVSGADGMSIEIQATNAKAQEMLQQNSGQLKSALENAGVSVSNVEVQYKPETRNNANAGSDQQNDQQNMSGQQHKGFNGKNEDQQEKSFMNEAGNWSDPDSIPERFSGDSMYHAGATQIAWQELTFDTVDVRI